MLEVIIAIIVQILAGTTLAYLVVSKMYTMSKELDERDQNEANSTFKAQK